MGERTCALEDVAVNREFWRGKKVFLTGHTGFKGGWLALWLNFLGARVFGYSLAPSTIPNLFETARVGAAIGHKIGDIRDLPQLQAALKESRPDVVLHLAAQSLVRQSYTEPVETYATNVLGTVHVLEAVRREPSARAVVIATSDKCYDNQERNEGYRESDPMGGRDPYSSSKGCAELVTAAYRASFFNSPKYAQPLGVASVRAGNVIGGGDWSVDRLIPDVFRAAKANEPVRIRNPKAVRPWQHVLEPLAGYLLLAQRLYDDGKRFAEGWNFGPAEADARPVAEVLDRIVKQWGGGLRWEVDGGNHPHEATLLRLDSTKARAELGWRPRMALDRALEWTVDWYKASLRGEDMQAFTLSQIAHYMELEKV
jgi:CDP-glucose 4,6-dehydratase